MDADKCTQKCTPIISKFMLDSWDNDGTYLNDGMLLFMTVCHVLLRYKMTPLMYASREGRTTIVDSLLAVTNDVNLQDNKGFTVCHTYHIPTYFVGYL